MSKYVKIGSIKKPFGVNGELKVDVDPAFLEDFALAKVVFVEVKGKPLPFFVESIRVTNAPLLKVEEVDNKEAASKISNSDLMLQAKDILPADARTLEVEEEETLEYRRCVGYDLVDSNTGPIGAIAEVLEYPQQEMALVKLGEKELLIPLHAQLILEIDEGKRILKMDLPEGLLDI